jgi:TonB family protein
VALEAPVTVTGARPSSEGTRDLFTEETRTILVFVDGAVIQLSAGVSAGQLLFLTNKKTSEEVVCQILHKKVHRPTVCYVEVQFTEEKPDFWGVSFAKEKAGPAAFKVAEQVAAQETTEEGRATTVAPRNEQDVEQLKRQVEALRQQVEELERRKTEQAASQQTTAHEMAPANDPVQQTGGEALLMPTAARGQKKAPRWAVPMALPGRTKTAQEAVAEKDSAEAMLPQPELDFSQVPEGTQAEQAAAGTSYKAKGIPPRRMRLIALGLALTGVLGFAVYAKVWTLFPVLKNAAVEVLQQAKNAVSKRAGGGKVNAPAAGGAAKSVAGSSPATAKNAPASAAPSAQGHDRAASDQGNAMPEAPSVASSKAADANAGGGALNPAVESRREPSTAKKPANPRERANGRSQAAQAPAAMEPKAAEIIPPDAPVIGPKLLHAAAPVYPPDAMWNYITGDVKAELVVGADGRVGEVKVLSGPKALRDAAIEALKKYEYAPGTQGGRPVAAKTTVTVKFWFNP